MSVTANGPDGSTFSFPDGTPQEIVRGVLAKHYGWSDGAPPRGGPASVPVEDKGALSADNIVRSLANGITFGGADRLAAFMGAHTGIGNAAPPRTIAGVVGDQIMGNGEGGSQYERNLAVERARTEAYATEHPYANAAGNIVGNVGGMAAAATIPGVAAALPDAAPTMLGKIGQGMAAGAGVGAVQGFNEAPDWSNVGDTVDATAKGAGMGAAFGLGAPFSRVARVRAIPRSPTRCAAMAAACRGPLVRCSRKGSPKRLLAKSMPRSKRSAPMRCSSTRRRRCSARGKARSATRPKRATSSASALKAREAGAPTRLAADTNENFGTAVSPTTSTRDILDHRATLDAQNYGQALGDAAPAVDAQPVVDLIDDHLKTAVGEQKKALTRLRAEIMEPNPDLAPGGGADPEPPKPQTLVNFIQGMGGVRSSEASDLVARGHNRFPGFVTSRGAAQDEVARAAHSAGYIGDGTDASAGTSTFQDVIDALDAHPTYSTHDADMLERWQNWTDAHKNPVGARMTAAEYRARQAAGAPIGPPAEVPTSNARKLHGLKMELDNVIEHDQPGLGVQAGALKSQNRSLTMARGAINDALEAQVPGYARANAISAPLAKRAEAVASGTKLLGSGPETPWPVDLAAQRATMTPGERAAQAMGLRGRVEEKFARTANDVTAGKAIAGGLGDFNRGNLSEVFGQEPTDRFIAAVDREKRFGETHNKLIGNSETDPRAKAAAAMAPAKIGTIHSVAQVGLKAVHALTSPAIKAILPDITKPIPKWRARYRRKARSATRCCGRSATMRRRRPGCGQRSIVRE